MEGDDEGCRRPFDMTRNQRSLQGPMRRGSQTISFNGEPLPMCWVALPLASTIGLGEPFFELTLWDSINVLFGQPYFTHI